MFKNLDEEIKKLTDKSRLLRKELAILKKESDELNVAFYNNRSVTKLEYNEIMDYYEAEIKARENEIKKLNAKAAKLEEEIAKLKDEKRRAQLLKWLEELKKEEGEKGRQRKINPKTKKEKEEQEEFQPGQE